MKIESELTEAQQKTLDGWMPHHRVCGRKYQSAIGGSITYLITPTGLGDIVIVRCNECKSELNLTDFENW